MLREGESVAAFLVTTCTAQKSRYTAVTADASRFPQTRTFNEMAVRLHS
jgi:hypothetical protein